MYGTHVIHAALSCEKRVMIELIVLINYKTNTPEHLLPIIYIAENKKIKITYQNKEKLDRYTGGRPHNGMVLKTLKREYIFSKRLEAIKHKAKLKEKGNLIVVFDQIVDPQNFGSIVRTAFFLGADLLIVNKANRPPLSPTVSKVSSGAIECLDIYAVKSLKKFLKEAKEESKYKIITTFIEKEKDVYMRVVRQNDEEEHTDIDEEEQTNEVQKPISLNELSLNKNDNVILIFGSEANGITPNLMKYSDFNVFIPPLLNKEYMNKEPYNLIESLNVGVSAGIIINYIKSHFIEKNTLI